MAKSIKKVRAMNKNNSGDMVYGFGLIGAAVFYVDKANGLGEVLVALLKAIVWPAYLVFKLLGM